MACVVVDENQPNDQNHALLGEMECLINELKHLCTNVLDLR